MVDPRKRPLPHSAGRLHNPGMPDTPASFQTTRTRALIVLATVAVVAALYIGAEFLIPIALAIVLNALFRPVVRAMERARIPTTVAAAIVVLGLMMALGAVAWGMAQPMKKWINAAPANLATAEGKLHRLRAPIEKVSNVVTKAESAVQGPTSGPTTQASAAAPAPVQPPGPPFELASSVLGTTTQVLGGLAEVLLLLFLLLASGGMFFQKLLHVLRHRRDQDKADDVVSEAEHVTLRYVVATAMINVAQATVIGLLMWWFGMPTPLLWAVFTFVFEFVPYLGAAAMIVLITATAIATFDSPGKILLPPLAYFVVTTLQNNLVSPIAYGKQLRLNPVAVLIGVMFWWYVWGVAGAFLAVPIVAMVKVFASKHEQLRPVCEFVSE
jgi:predicted PurR-regulated permease PerM